MYLLNENNAFFFFFRFGEICNACVLIVKRWRMLPKDTKKNWHHVVDSRVGPGGSKVTFRNVKKKVEPVEEKFEKIRKKKVKVKKVIKPDLNLTDNDVSGFIDLTYFKRYSKIFLFVFYIE